MAASSAVLLSSPVSASAQVALKSLIDAFSTVVSTEITKSAEIDRLASGQLANAEVISKYKNKVENVERVLHVQNNTNVCNSMGAVNAHLVATEKSRGSAARGSRNAVNRLSTSVNQEAESIARYNESMTRYCTKSDVATGRCQAPGQRVDHMAGADMQATTLFSAIGADAPSDTYADPRQEAAADEFIRRVSAADPPEMLPNKCKTAQCKMFEDSRRSYLAIKSLPLNSLNEIKASHLPGGESSISAAQPVTVALNSPRQSAAQGIYAYVAERLGPNAVKSSEGGRHAGTALSVTSMMALKWIGASVGSGSRGDLQKQDVRR